MKNLLAETALDAEAAGASHTVKQRAQIEEYGLMHPNTVLFIFVASGLLFWFLVLLVVRFIARKYSS
jgi:hypothetical protein